MKKSDGPSVLGARFDTESEEETEVVQAEVKRQKRATIATINEVDSKVEERTKS